MNRNTCDVYKNEYNPLYYSTDSTKAAMTLKGSPMKSPEYFDLEQFIQQESTCQYTPLDSILSKLDNQNLRDLKEIIKDFYEAGKEDGISQQSSSSSYDEGYSDGYEDAKELYLHDGD